MTAVEAATTTMNDLGEASIQINEVVEQTATNHEIARSLSQAAQQAELVTTDVTSFLRAAAG